MAVFAEAGHLELPDETTINTYPSFSYLACNLSVGFNWLSHDHSFDGLRAPTAKGICLDANSCAIGRLSRGAKSHEGLSKTGRAPKIIVTQTRSVQRCHVAITG